MKKILDVIKTDFLRRYPDIMDVYFTERQSYLGSSPELPEEERTITITVINIVINNLKNNLTRSQKYELTENIYDRLERVYSIQPIKYGAKWNVKFYIAEIKEYFRHD
jgi:hypothetical protein